MIDGRWSDFSASPRPALSHAAEFCDARWHLTAACAYPSVPIVLLCRTFNAGGVTVRNREVNLPYKQDGDDDTDEISGVVTKHCAANGARTVAVAVNFSDRVSRLPSAVLLLVVPASKSVIQTDFLLQGGQTGLLQ